MSLTPQQVIDNADGLFGLVNILSQPEAFKSKIEELKTHASQGNTAFDKAQEALAESRRLSAEAEQTKVTALAEKDAALSEAKTTLSKATSKVADMADRENSVAERAIQLQTLSQTLAQKQSDLIARETEVKRNLQIIEDGKANLIIAQDNFSKQKQAHEERVSKLKAAVSQ